VVSSKTFSYTVEGYNTGNGIVRTPHVDKHTAEVHDTASQLDKFQQLLRERVEDVVALQPSQHGKAMKVEVENLHTKSMGWVMEMWRIGEAFPISLATPLLNYKPDPQD
ncbi:MAG: hypothetical protein Q9174_006388, partial [Haloplaca sp. 1 TL-2023]